MRLLPLLLLAACHAPTSAPLDDGGAAAASIVRRLSCMGTGLELEVSAPDRAVALRASEAAVRALEATQARLSTWTEDSELSGLNRASVGVARDLSPALAAELAAAYRWWELTDGAFDPGVGAMVMAWDLRGAGRLPTPDERRRAQADSGLRHLRLDGRRATRLHAGLLLEEGGFGKGAGLDHGLAALRAAGATSGTLDLGGQLAFLGRGPFEVQVAHPLDRDRPVLTMDVDGGSVATSGNSERGLTVNGARLGHLLDPRSGEPAPDFGSLTVWAPTALAADALSTGLYVLGPERALALAAGIDDVEVLVLEPLAGGGLRARCTPGLAGRLNLNQREVGLDLVSLPPPPIQSTP